MGLPFALRAPTRPRRARALSLALFGLRFGPALAGSGCNEVVKDPGPWIEQLDVEKTEEGFQLTLRLTGGDVAAASTESVELLLGREAAEQPTKHFVLPKAGSRKGGIIELRTEEALLGGVEGAFAVQATLAEYNGNAHGPESLACRREEGGKSTCQRSKKASGAEPSALPPAAAGHMMGEGDMSHGEGHPMREGHAMAMGEGHMPMGAGKGPMARAGRSQGMIKGPSPRPESDCHPDTSPCPLGSTCEASTHGNFYCAKELPLSLRKSFTDPSTGHGLRVMVAGALFVCVSCLCGALFLTRCAARRDARSFDSSPKVLGKVDDPTLAKVAAMTRHRAFEDSDSDEDVYNRVW